jgi:hypothetical protein
MKEGNWASASKAAKFSAKSKAGKKRLLKQTQYFQDMDGHPFLKNTMVRDHIYVDVTVGAVLCSFSEDLMVMKTEYDRRTHQEKLSFRTSDFATAEAEDAAKEAEGGAEQKSNNKGRSLGEAIMEDILIEAGNREVPQWYLNHKNRNRESERKAKNLSAVEKAKEILPSAIEKAKELLKELEKAKEMVPSAQEVLPTGSGQATLVASVPPLLTASSQAAPAASSQVPP